jgi:[ribosomal protein S5]-alanine N-acetyltransferase
MQFKSSRLIYRPLILSDLDNIYNYIYSDERVMNFISGGVLTKDMTLNKLKILIEQFKTDKFGFLAVLNDNKEFIGIGGLKKLDNTNEIELGYILKYDSWGNGYATEIAIFFVNYGFNILNLTKIVAIVNPLNIKSIKVIQKLNFMFLSQQYFYNDLYNYYIILNNQSYE